MKTTAALLGDDEHAENDEALDEMKLVDEMGYDLEARRYACLALGNLLAQHENHDQVLAAGALARLVDSMDADLDLETRFNAVYACNKMATRNSNHEIMVSGGILKPLVALCGEEDQHAGARPVLA